MRHSTFAKSAIAAAALLQLPLSHAVDPVSGAAGGALLGWTIAMAQHDETEMSTRGSFGTEARYFFEDPAYPEQEEHTVSAHAEANFFFPMGDSYNGVNLSLFGRVDSADDNRSHADLRELYYLHVARDWEMRVGLGKTFWGVTEAQHLVDIVNQTDQVENIDGEDKLGQPILHFTFLQAPQYGILDLFILPGFRERTYVGEEGRLRLPLAVDESLTTYEASNDEAHTDLAFRWHHTIDVFDIGISHFRGTSRDPVLELANFEQPAPNVDPQPTAFAAYYPLISQTGLDFQASLDGWLWKLEVISRAGEVRSGDFNSGQVSVEDERYTALDGGFEYTVYDVFQSGRDLGLIMEWNYDDRQEQATTTFQNDVLLGTRWVFNDIDSSEILFGVVQDLDYGSTTVSIEANTRLTPNITVEVEGRGFVSIDEEDVFAGYFEKDSFIQASLDYNF
ncbi:MAG: hypothetical protein ACQES2_01120 [Pseudomonadota bacterium]